ncbi:MAG: RHS repeat-associated core domain-containing protein [Chitinophagales bacterium]
METPSEILQEKHFYPFGMEMEGPWMQSGANNPYQYNGKELVSDFGLNLIDYGARWYDAAVGRWWSVDPLAEDYASLSGYNYVMNNPLRLVDPDGKAPCCGGQGDSTPNRDFADGGGYLGGGGSGIIPGASSYSTGTGTQSGGVLSWLKAGAIGFGVSIGLIDSDTKSEPAQAVDTDSDSQPDTIGDTQEDDEQDKGGFLVRLGPGPETKEGLSMQAANAEKNPKYGHGVSTMWKKRISGSDRKNRSATYLEVSQQFKVKQTGSNSNHYTVFLPKPVTEETTATFNKVFSPVNSQ